MENKNPTEKNCIMPEMPYCPDCEWGSVTFDEEAAFYFRGESLNTEWHCTYPGFYDEIERRDCYAE